MNKTILLAACFFSIFVTSGCRGTIMEPAPDNFVCTDPNSCAGNTYQTSEFQSVDPSADENEFVNYTKVAADYREYGERTPRDQNITQAAAGNNLSASIPPSIEDEVVDYEEEIKLTEDNGQSDFSAPGHARSPCDPLSILIFHLHQLQNITEDVKYDYYYRTSSREKQLQNGYIALPAESALHAPDFAV